MIRKKMAISLHINLIDTAVISILEMKKLRHGEVYPCHGSESGKNAEGHRKRE